MITANYTPAEIAHNCQACTLSNAMKSCKTCLFHTPRKNNENYHIVYKDRSDTHNPTMAIFFMVYSKKDDSVLWESSTYYSDTELERVAERIKHDLRHGTRANNRPCEICAKL